MNKAPLYILAVGILVGAVGGLVYWYTTKAPAVEAPIDTVLVPGAKDDSRTISESGQYFKIKARVPVESTLASTAGTEASNKAVALMETSIEAQVAEFKKQDISWLTDRPEGESYPLEFDANYSVTENAHLISYDFQIYQFAGGAHGGTVAETYTFDKKTGERIELADLFVSESPYLERISAHTRARLLATLGEYKDEKWITEGTLPSTKNFQSFLVDGDSLTIIFGQYQVGPYVLGMPEIQVPLSTLSDILKPEYR
jgi:hypothetical protein